MATKAKKSCFIIMPITVPDHLSNVYTDKKHFDHILNHLFVPAVKKADFDPIEPKRKGAELIHAKIIEDLQKADLVLCDMSVLNPNVFFELGIRTAQNRAICLTKDNHTKSVPFDTNIINYHTYQSDLRPWNTEDQISDLSEHIKESAQTSDGNNTMWEKFAISLAASIQPKEGEEGKLDFIQLQLDSINKKLDLKKSPMDVTRNERLLEFTGEILSKNKISAQFFFKGGTFIVETDDPLPDVILKEITNYSEYLGIYFKNELTIN